MTGYTFDPKSRQYHDSNGNVVALAVIISLRDAIADHARDEAKAITAAYLARQATLSAWADKFAAVIKDAVIAGYLLGRGGKNAVTAADDAKIAPILSYHLDAAKGFATALSGSDATPMVDDSGNLIDPSTMSIDENGDVVDENGDVVMVNGEALTEADLSAVGDSWSGVDGLLNRAGSYEASAIGGFSGGQSAAWDGASLPEEPPAHSSCRCYTTFYVDGDGQVIGNWNSVAGACPVCVDLDAEYSDYETGVYVDVGTVIDAGDDGG